MAGVAKLSDISASVRTIKQISDYYVVFKREQYFLLWRNCRGRWSICRRGRGRSSTRCQCTHYRSARNHPKQHISSKVRMLGFSRGIRRDGVDNLVRDHCFGNCFLLYLIRRKLQSTDAIPIDPYVLSGGYIQSESRGGVGNASALHNYHYTGIHNHVRPRMADV